jgi:hypothetical protein
LPLRPIVEFHFSVDYVAQIVASWFKKYWWLSSNIDIHDRGGEGGECEYKPEQNDTLPRLLQISR